MFEDYRFREIFTAAAFAGVMLLVTSCASAPMPPTASLNEARLAIEVAQSVDASRHASAEMDEARQKLRSADEAVTMENMILAERYAKQSKVMAELAAAKTESVKALAVNEELNRGAQALIEEMQRTGDQQ